MVILFSIVLLACGQSAQGASGPEKSSECQFVIGPSQVLMPKGAFLLIRKGREIGAIRFTSIERGEPIGAGKASYESYFQSDGSGSFRSPKVRKQTGNIDLKPLEGIGRISFQFGKDRVRIGDWSFRSSYPGYMSMWTYRGSEKDYGFEFAATSAREVSEIDASNKRLKWFRFSANDQVTLEVSDLPK